MRTQIMKAAVFFLTQAVALAVIASGCSGGSEAEPDPWVVYGVVDTEALLFDQHLVGQPAGSQDLEVACSLGGTVHIVGETTSSSGYATVDLIFSMADCRNTGTGYDLTMSGDLHWQGSFATTGYKAVSTQATSLHVVGTSDRVTDPIDETCVLAVTDRGETGQASHISGEWCGRAVEF